MISAQVPKDLPDSVTPDLLLVILIEECAEIQKACTKTLRFGPHGDKAPEAGYKNIDDLLVELGELHAVMSMFLAGFDKEEQKRLSQIFELAGHNKIDAVIKWSQ